VQTHTYINYYMHTFHPQKRSNTNWKRKCIYK
jgi:predicted metal-dependent hydrolase